MTAPQQSAAELTTAEKAEVMIAAEKGGLIQDRFKCVLSSSTPPPWRDCPDPTWNWEDHDYRVKPEERVPRTVTISCDDKHVRRVNAWPDMDPGQTITFTELPPGWVVKPPQS